MRRRPRQTLFAYLDIESAHINEVRRTLQLLSRQESPAGHHVYMISSAGAGEGKSTMCGLLGIVAAKMFSKKTLIIDADLRRPSIHRVLGVAQRPGLTDIFASQIPPENAMRSTMLPNLRVMPGGSLLGKGTAAYDDRAFGDLIRQLRPSFDLIFIDSSPMLPVVEPLMIAEHVDGILVVVMAGKTPVTVLQRFRQVVEPVRPKVVGIIVNNAMARLPYYYDHRYYGYTSSGQGKTRPGRA